MDIALLDADAKLVVSEKEKALLGKFLKVAKFYFFFVSKISQFPITFFLKTRKASYECIKVLELKIKRLENVLTQKEARLTELKKAAQYTKA